MDSIDKRRRFIINTVFFSILAGMLWFTFHYLLGWLMPFIIGFVIAYLMNPAISWLNGKLRISRKFLAYVFTISLAVILGLLAWLAVYLAFKGIQNGFNRLPDFFTNEIQPVFYQLNTWINDLIAGFSPDIQDNVATFQTSLLVELQKLIMNLSMDGVVFFTNPTKGLPTFLVTFIFTILATIFSNEDYPDVRAFILKTLPKKYRILVVNIKVMFLDTMVRYLKAYLKIMSITFVELTIGFIFLGIPNPLLIALIIAIFDILPVLGTGGILIPWIVLQLVLGNWTLAGGLAILYGVVTVMRNILEPRIVGGQLGLDPLVTLVSIYLGFMWLGVFGMLLVPIATNIFLKLYQQGKLKSFINLEALYAEDHLMDDEGNDIGSSS